MLTDIEDSVTSWFWSKPVIQWSLKIPRHRNASLHARDVNIKLRLNFKRFWLIYIATDIQNVLLWLRRWSMASSIRCVLVQPTNQSDAVSNHHTLYFCLVDSLLKCAPDFLVNRIDRVTAVRRSQIWKFIGWPRSHRLLRFRSGGSECCTDCFGNCSMRKRSQPE